MIEIEAPDGTIVEFPDGTDDSTIEQAMRQAYPPEQAAAPAKPKLSERIAGGLRDFADENVFPDGIAESALDGVTRGAAALVENPINAVKTAGRALIVDPAKSIATAPANAVNAVGGAGLALGAAVDGDEQGAQDYAQGALASATDAGIGALEAATLGRGGAVLRGGQQVARPAPSQLAQDFARSNVDPSIAALSRSDAPRTVSAAIGENAAAGTAVRKNTANQLSQAEARKNAIADSLDAGADTSVAGEAIINGVKAHKSQAGRYYERAYKDIDTAAKARPTNTLNAVNNQLERFDDPVLQDMFEAPIMKRIRGAAQNGAGLTVADIKELRTVVRESASAPKAFQTKDEAALGRLQSAISEDLYAAVAETSGPAAAARLKAADRFYAKTITRVKDNLKPFSKLDQTNENAFAGLRSAMQGQTSSRGRGNVKMLSELKKAISSEELDTVRAGLFRDMGRTTEGGEFSVGHFTTEWNKFGGAQKDIIFGTGTVRKDMDALANTMQALAKVEGQRNFSRSGVSVQNVATLGGVANPVTAPLVVKAVIAGQASGRLLTNPRYVKMMRRLGDAEYQAARAKNSAESLARLASEKKKALAQIAAIENADATYRGELESLRKALNDNESQTPPLPPQTSAVAG